MNWLSIFEFERGPSTEMVLFIIIIVILLIALVGMILADKPSQDDWVTDEPEEEDTYLITWVSKSGRRFVGLTEYYPGEGWDLGYLEKRGYKDIKVIAYKPVDFYRG